MKSDSLSVSYDNIKTEIDILKSEKLSSNKKINELQDKLDESVIKYKVAEYVCLV